jgi:hypothetical protein
LLIHIAGRVQMFGLMHPYNRLREKRIGRSPMLAFNEGFESQLRFAGIG